MFIKKTYTTYGILYLTSLGFKIRSEHIVVKAK